MSVTELIRILQMFETNAHVRMRNHHLEDTEILEVKIQVDKKTKLPVLILAERKL